MDHTPTPWTYQYGKTLLHIESSADSEKAGLPICSLPIKKKADADYILKACNAYKDLIEHIEVTKSFLFNLGADGADNDLVKLLEKHGDQ